MKIHSNFYLIRSMAYRHDNLFRAVCLDLDLYAEGRSLAEAMKRLDSAVEGYLNSVIKDHACDPKLLDRPAPKKYWGIYDLLRELSERGSETRSKKYCEGGVFTKELELTHV